MKRLTKAVGVILSIVIFFGIVALAPVQAGAAEPTRTVMLYCIGSDLELDAELATSTFIRAMEADYDENVSFIVMTGGTKRWFTPSEYLNGAEKIDPKYNQIWKLEGKSGEEAHGKMTLLEETGIEGCGRTSMAKPATLTSFLDYCYENYPSDSYDLILWDHGGGPAYGFGYDEYGDDLSLSETALAFSESGLIQSDKKLDMVIYDACLMGNTETIAALGDYADYFICSPEEVPGGGIDHKNWLDAVKAEPSLSGGEIGKLIADDFVETYADGEYSECAVMAVIDTAKYKAQMLPLLNGLSATLLDEATVRGDNGLYNFYDEIYSIGANYVYSTEEYCLADLESIVSPLSCQQIEINNGAEELSNCYTVTAKAIFDVIAEGEAVYFGRSEPIRSTVENRNLRNKNGVFAQIGGPPAIIQPTGLSVFYPSGDIAAAYDYIEAVRSTIESMPDGDAKTFLTRYASAVACYALITEFGITASELAAEGTEDITYDLITDRMRQEETFDDYASPMISLLGEYVFSGKAEAEEYLAEIAAQQANDSVTYDDISVDDGRLIISNPSTQALIGISSASVIKGDPSCLEFKMLLSRHGYSYLNRKKYFPNGFFNTLSSAYIGRFETEAGSPFEIELQKPPESVLAVYDSEGDPHIADLNFTNASHTAGYIPLVVLKGYIEDKNYYLYVRKTKDGWQIDGLSETIGGSYIPMDSEEFTHERNEIAYTTVSWMTDAVYGKTTLLPISDFCHLDNSAEAWGMTVRELSLSELPEPYTYEPYYALTDIYGNATDITDIVKTAEETVILGDTDGSGTVDINDATMLQMYLAKFDVSESFVTKAADTNGDGVISIKDVTFIQRWLAHFVIDDRIGKPLQQ